MQFFQMKSIELPNTFCGCMNLRTGGKVISVVCTVTSMIAFFVFDFYLDSEPSEVVKEIGGKDREKLKKLQESNESKSLAERCQLNLIYSI